MCVRINDLGSDLDEPALVRTYQPALGGIARETSATHICLLNQDLQHTKTQTHTHTYTYTFTYALIFIHRNKS